MLTRCIAFEGLLGTGGSRPFLGTDDRQRKWVVKIHGNPQGTKAILNEYVAGLLANAIGLPWPMVTIVELSAGVLASLERASLVAQSEWAVGLAHIAGLKAADWPAGGYEPAKGFAERNARHIQALFPRAETHAAFYGKTVFDNWLFLEDKKYDTLQIDPSGAPIFLDASLALGGTDWQIDVLEWDLAKVDIQSPYAEGVLTDMTRFQPWFMRMEQMEAGSIDAILASVPAAWSVPRDYALAVADLLRHTRDWFLPVFREWVDCQSPEAGSVGR